MSQAGSAESGHPASVIPQDGGPKPARPALASRVSFHEAQMEIPIAPTPKAVPPPSTSHSDASETSSKASAGSLRKLAALFDNFVSPPQQQADVSFSNQQLSRYVGLHYSTWI